MNNEEKCKLITETLSTPRGKRNLAWAMTAPLMGGRKRPLPWEGYPDSPPGTLEVWDDKESYMFS